MTMGTIIGDSSSAVTPRRKGMAGWDRPSPARVPNVVATAAAATPISSELRAARCHGSPSKTCSYQRRE